MGISVRKSILLAEDDINTRHELEALFSENGYDVTVTSNGLDALELAKTRKYDLVVTDIYMPKLDGLDFIVTLKRIHQEVKALIITGCDRAESGESEIEDTYARALQKYGGFDVLKKPFRGSELLKKVEQILK